MQGWFFQAKAFYPYILDVDQFRFPGGIAGAVGYPGGKKQGIGEELFYHGHFYNDPR